jgi:hypothetical protein
MSVAPTFAIALSAAAWLALVCACVSGSVVFTAMFLLLGLTGCVLALASVVIDRCAASLVAFVVTLSVPVATWVYVSHQPEGWLG